MSRAALLVRLLGVALALLAAVPPARADESQGLEWLRQARAALDANDAGRALELVVRAGDALPFSDRRALAHHMRADILTRRAAAYEAGLLTPPELSPSDPGAAPGAAPGAGAPVDPGGLSGVAPGPVPGGAQVVDPTQLAAARAAAAGRDLDAALEAYTLALTDARAGAGPVRPQYDFRAHVNAGVLRHRRAEQALTAAGVPLSAEAIPVDADPTPLKQAIQAQRPELVASRRAFLEALALQDDAGARQSIEALTRRLDELDRMLEKLEEMEQEQEDQDEEDGEDENEQDQDQEGEGDEEQDGEQDPQDGEDEGQDDQQDEDEEDGEGEDEPQDQPPPDEQQEPSEPQAAPQLTAAQLADLLEQLEDLEERALQMDRQRRAAQHQPVEKDW